jgi:mutual gliding-motility protein MglA
MTEMLINHASRQVAAKIVYYGPGLSGKTTNLQYIFSVTNPKSRGELVSMETEVERTLFFDLLPINVGVVNGYEIRFQLYTVPGQVFYAATRKLVLKASDGVVFVADSQELMENSNLESLDNLKENLQFYKTSVDKIQLVLQYNKRDLRNLSPVDRLNSLLNPYEAPFFEASAKEGRGVLETLREISQLTLQKITEVLDHETKHKHIKPVRFDTDAGQEIIDKDKLPYKKISVDSFSSVKPEISAPLIGPDVEPFANTTTDEPEPLEQPVTIIQLQDEPPAPTPPPKEFESDSNPEIEVHLSQSDRAAEPDAEPLDLTQFEPVSIVSDPPMAITADVAPPPAAPPAPAAVSAAPDPAPTGKRDTGSRPAQAEKPDPKKEANTFLSQFEDTSRVTKIDKIKVSDNEIHMEITDKSGTVLKKLVVKMHDDTKKINVILDVKR